MQLQEHFAQIQGVKVHYMESTPDRTAGDNQCIIFLHGFPEHWATWHAQLAYFANDYRVIAPDLPGYNLSDKPQDVSFYQVPNLIAFMAEFIQTVAEGQKVYLVAHDWGGAIAWPLAAFYPQWIKKLIILNSGHPSVFTREMIHNQQQRQKSEYIHLLISKKGAEKLSANNYAYLQDTLFAGMRQGCLTTEQKMAYLKAWQQPSAVEGMLQYYRAMPQLAPSTKTDKTSGGPVKEASQMRIPNIRIEVPTLVLWGEKDEAFVVENLDGIQDYVPDCQIKRFPDASHWLQHEKPNEVNRELQRFIETK